MVEVVEAPEVNIGTGADEALDESSALSAHSTRWSRLGPLLLVAFVVGFTAWLLRSELHTAIYSNDNAGHSALARFAEQRIRSGRNPFDAWFPYFGLGTPQFTQYQSLAHIVTGFLSLVLGGWVFRGSNYLLLCTLPIPVYAGSRLIGLTRWEAGAAALFSPMLSNSTGFGIEWNSFVWAGYGLWTMLWGVWLLPIALGLGWRAVRYGERIALTAFVFGLICALHFTIAYFVLMALVVFALTRIRGFIMRVGQILVVGIGGMAIFAFVFVPTYLGLKYVNIDAIGIAPDRRDSYGPKQVLTWLFQGKLFDSGRLPVVSILVAVGVVISLMRARRSEAARVPLGLLGLSLLLYSGRTVVGPVINYLPGGQDLMLHRYIVAVHIAGLFLAGVGAVWAFQRATVATRSVWFRKHGAVAVALSCALAIVAMYPIVKDRQHIASTNTKFINRQVAADNADAPALRSLIDVAKQRDDGRIYSGGSISWGSYLRLAGVPFYLLPVQQDADSSGFYLVTNSLSADIEPLFKDTDAAAYDLLDVRYVLQPTAQRPSLRSAKLLARRGRYSLYQVHTSGYLEVVDTTKALRADRGNMADVMLPYLKSRAFAKYRHPFVAFDGRATPQPTTTMSAPYAGPPGVVDKTSAELTDGRFSGEVNASRPAWVMLKESYSPQWTATVDGKPVKTQMLAPSFVGVPVPAGRHTVVFSYKSRSFYPALFAFGALTLLGLALGPAGWRRYRQGRPRGGATASQ